MEDNWTVYSHISPSGKVYIGITHLKNPERRWGKDGKLYVGCTVFLKAISKYGWNNIEHKILYTNCSERVAKDIEKTLIGFYKLFDMSYNMTVGGDGHNFGMECTTTEYRTKQSQKYRATHPNYDKDQYEKHKEAIKTRAREYYRKNREKVLEQKKQECVKIKTRERCKKWREEHPDYMKEYMKNYNKENR